MTSGRVGTWSDSGDGSWTGRWAVGWTGCRCSVLYLE